MYEELLKEFKIFREQVYAKFADYDEILRTLIDGNSEAIDDIIVSMLEKDGESNV